MHGALTLQNEARVLDLLPAEGLIGGRPFLVVARAVRPELL